MNANWNTLIKIIKSLHSIIIDLVLNHSKQWNTEFIWEGGNQLMLRISFWASIQVKNYHKLVYLQSILLQRVPTGNWKIIRLMGLSILIMFLSILRTIGRYQLLVMLKIIPLFRGSAQCLIIRKRQQMQKVIKNLFRQDLD